MGLRRFQRKRVVRPSYRFCNSFTSGIAVVQHNTTGLYRFIRSDSSPLLSTEYRFAYSFVLGRAPVRQGRESAWIDETGKAIFLWIEG
jgi:hypothetical protein